MKLSSSWSKTINLMSKEFRPNWRQARDLESHHRPVSGMWLDSPFQCEWGSPTFIVSKKAKGSWRLVVDFRPLTSMTEMDRYEIPLINVILQAQVEK